MVEGLDEGVQEARHGVVEETGRGVESAGEGGTSSQPLGRRRTLLLLGYHVLFIKGRGQDEHSHCWGGSKERTVQKMIRRQQRTRQTV